MTEQGYPAGCARCKALREALEDCWSVMAASVNGRERELAAKMRAALAKPKADK